MEGLFVVNDLDRLVGNLCPIWNWSFHLHELLLVFERANKPVKPSRPSQSNAHGTFGSFVSAARDFPPLIASCCHVSFLTRLFWDDSCVVERDLSCHVMGRVKDINSIPNLRILLAKEGFEHVKLSYLGGLWVLIELDNEGSKQKFLDHVGVNSWFCTLLNAYNDFVSDERVVWVDIEGIPLHVWSRETFAKIGNKWGEALDIEDNFGSSFARVAESVYTSDDESKHGARILNDGAQNSDVDFKMMQCLGHKDEKVIIRDSGGFLKKEAQAMFFKVDFAKAYDSVRWDYLLDILHAFGFGPNWCRWIRGTFTSSMASILVNGSPTSSSLFDCGLITRKDVQGYDVWVPSKSKRPHMKSEEIVSKTYLEAAGLNDIVGNLPSKITLNLCF
ncbi:RNA-directed DNA polymerase, eukaryota [Tanacetum coccineum]